MQSGDFSCEFAVKRTATSAQTLIGDNTHDYWRIQVGYAGVSNQLQFIGNGGSVLCQSASTVASNAWDHWIVTYTGGTMKMYRNGNLDVTQTGITFANRPASTDAIRLGDATGGGFSLVGYLQKMALYSSALSSGTVTSHYNAWVQAESAATNDVLYVSEQNSSGTFAMRQICDNLSFLPDFAPTGLTGATAASRYVGATTGGPPASGTFAVGDHVIDQTGPIWVCTAAGSPGTWFPVGGTVAVNGQTGTTYSLALSDVGKVVELNNASAITLTVTKDATVSWPLNALIGIFQLGAGQVTITADTGVTLLSDGSLVHTKAQYASVSLRRRAANTWVLSGDLA
jgi:hypothetical protein